ncbi:MAG: hypothetical protein JOZ58_07035 [Acetobacteraceae bacterium]|nr:hypothetical protein [Acetobacteraceae bacterium]
MICINTAARGGEWSVVAASAIFEDQEVRRRRGHLRRFVLAVAGPGSRSSSSISPRRIVHGPVPGPVGSPTRSGPGTPDSSRLIGHRLRVRLYDNRLERFPGSTAVLTLPRGRRPRGTLHGRWDTRPTIAM